jgi:hypothetical protein
MVVLCIYDDKLDLHVAYRHHVLQWQPQRQRGDIERPKNEERKAGQLGAKNIQVVGPRSGSCRSRVFSNR